MTTKRPRITAHRESIVPDQVAPAVFSNAPANVQTAKPVSVQTTTVSMRVPVDLAEAFNKELRRLHFETGATKGAIAAAMLEAAIGQAGKIEKELANG